MAKDKKKITVADQLEAEMRRQYLPTRLANVMGEILDIEFNAKWCATEIGRKAAKAEHNYEDADLEKVLGKQADHRITLETKKNFIKELINKTARAKPGR